MSGHWDERVSRLRRWLIPMALVTFGFAGCAPASPEIVYRDVAACGDPPAFNVQTKYSVEAWAIPDSRFGVGEPLTLQMRVAAPSFVTLFHVSSSCKVTRLLDNARMPMAEIVDYPAKDSGLQIAVKPPGGTEGFYFIATLERLSFLAPGDILSENHGIAAIDMSPSEFYARLEQARARMNPASWGLTTLRTEVVEH